MRPRARRYPREDRHVRSSVISITLVRTYASSTPTAAQTSTARQPVSRSAVSVARLTVRRSAGRGSRWRQTPAAGCRRRRPADRPGPRPGRRHCEGAPRRHRRSVARRTGHGRSGGPPPLDARPERLEQGEDDEGGPGHGEGATACDRAKQAGQPQDEADERHHEDTGDGCPRDRSADDPIDLVEPIAQDCDHDGDRDADQPDHGGDPRHRSQGWIGPLVAWPNTVAPTSPIPARVMAAANHFSC